MPNDLSLITCGNAGAFRQGSDLGRILDHLLSSIDYLMDQISWLGEQESRRISMLGPFLLRSLLEVAMTTLIGRLDPTRLLVVRQIQAQPNYDPRVPWKASIRWQGDVVAEKKVATLWNDTLEYKEMTKALLGDYYDNLHWRPAAEHMLEVAEPRGEWLAQLAATGIDSFVARKRDEVGRLYSSLSKGIHHEFVLPDDSQYDRNTIGLLALQVVHSVADLGLVSHFIPHASFALSPRDAIAVFNRIETVEVMK